MMWLSPFYCIVLFTQIGNGQLLCHEPIGASRRPIASSNRRVAQLSLFRTLFLAYFRRFDLHYDFHLRDVPGIQQTIAVILWRLDTVARDWKPVRGLAPEILLPGVLNQLREAMVSQYDKEEWILAGYVLDPLFDLGLIERKQRAEWPSVTEKDFIRVTALWRKFITFAWNGGAR